MPHLKKSTLVYSNLIVVHRMCILTYICFILPLKYILNIFSVFIIWSFKNSSKTSKKTKWLFCFQRGVRKALPTSRFPFA